MGMPTRPPLAISNIEGSVIEITEVEEQRYYDGLPSVTTITSLLREPWLERWRGRIGNEEADRIKNEASWLGTLVHDTLASLDIAEPCHKDPVALYDPGRLDPLTAHCVKLYLEWANTILDQWVMVEQPLISTKLGFGGTPDRVGVIKGDNYLTLVDFKTGWYSKQHRFQTAGYRILLRDNNIEVGRTLAIYLPTTIEKGQSLSVKEHDNPARDERGFMDLLDLYNILQTMK